MSQQPMPTVAEVFALYQAEYLPAKAPTPRYQQGRMLLAMAPDFGALPLDALTPAWLRGWRETLQRRYSPGTVRYYMATLSTVLTMAVRDYEWLPDNPLHKVKKPPEPPSRVRFLTIEERQSLVAACQQSRTPALYILVMLALGTGARKRELLHLRWREVDFTRGMLRFERTKNGERRGVQVPSLVLQLLQDWWETRRLKVEWVFPGARGTQPMDCGTAWEQAVKRAGLEDFRFHDLRHTAASYLAMSGASLRDIAEVLGHKTLAMSAKYAHLTQGHTAQVVERMAEVFLGTP